MIRINSVSFRYGESLRNAISDVSLTIDDGDFLGIIGASGAGKSTLVYSINGVIPHHFRGDFFGEVLVDGMDTVQTRPEELAKFVGSVHQDIDSQMVASVVEDEILFGLENFKTPHSEIELRIEEALAAAGISGLRDRDIGSLSGGQKQKVAIAAIIALRPKIILLDEPTGELDPQSSRKVFETLRELNERFGITVIVVEQKIMLLCEFSKHLAVMERGGMILNGLVHEVLQRADKLEEAGVNIPRVTTLARKLRERGLYSGAMPLDLDGARVMMREAMRDAAL
ncbi:MAG: ATP-binding cassette domain-containing protein [Synergistaceae bacterium]|jgi:energy-coupling factor transport system ATP-binding protein|nr:ATP-binding cassette domain-containing protein [Synergistaceae bacterium]